MSRARKAVAPVKDDRPARDPLGTLCSCLKCLQVHDPADRRKGTPGTAQTLCPHCDSDEAKYGRKAKEPTHAELDAAAAARAELAEPAPAAGDPLTAGQVGRPAPDMAESSVLDEPAAGPLPDLPADPMADELAAEAQRLADSHEADAQADAGRPKTVMAIAGVVYVNGEPIAGKKRPAVAFTDGRPDGDGPARVGGVDESAGRAITRAKGATPPRQTIAAPPTIRPEPPPADRPCKRCNAGLSFAVNAKGGAVMPLDTRATIYVQYIDDAGLSVCENAADMVKRGFVLLDENSGEIIRGAAFRVTHYATCPKADTSIKARGHR